ncbi:MAG: lipocalin family protein [Planctomycetes bacterium]|nr:lipocalin family protein [Planctomycetota bacterium]
MTAVAPTRIALATLVALLAGCSTPPPLPTAQLVELDRFMGDWFVIAHIPAAAEREACNGVESYELRPDGRVATTYAFREGGFDGPLRVLQPVGRVRNRATNATWGMQFFWPFEAEYLITWLDPFYEATIIGRTERDYAWIMTRTPAVSDERYAELVAELARQGYDTARLRRVPQRWPDPSHPAAARLETMGRATASGADPEGDG